ncbi:cation-translocating P-type ATPase [Candidatus Peregrinibacteria bacterium]|nr:cation-translocating P-type ATPase [Candidatus Peregrinibacteria bacterium]
MSSRDVLTWLSVVENRGLKAEEAAERLKECGSNELRTGKSISAWTLLLEQCKNILVIMLLIAAGLSGVLGHEVEAIAIAVIVLFAVILGFMQEYRAGRAIEALQEMAAPTAKVLRGGEQIEIPAREVVPGDIIMLSPGDRVPADARIVLSVNMHAEEAALTGESVPVAKITDPVTNPKAAVGDRRNMLYAGTVISHGRGTAVVIATGMRTEFGTIAGLLESVEAAATPLQQNLDRVGKTLAKVAGVISVVIGTLGIMRGEPLLDMLIFAIALAVAVVPEALPAVVTISLAIGVQRMVRRNALVRRLPAVETLGCTTVICSDKTGTLTKDEMTIRRIAVAGSTYDVSGSGYEPHGSFTVGGTAEEPNDVLMDLLTAGVLCGDTRLVKEEGGWNVKGDPTEGALVVAGAKAGLMKAALDEGSPRTGEIPFTSESKRITTLHKSKNGPVAYAKGAYEIILASCASQRTANGNAPLTPADREAILRNAESMAGDSLRVLALAEKRNATLGDAETGMTFLGLVGMSDPPRPEAKEAVSKCKAAGIRVVMITGDHHATAAAIAREIGILEDGEVINGAELDTLSESELREKVQHVSVYARVSPTHKLSIVDALQKLGHVVAMTGDGVNDAPALKKADIGIAMGITGTDVTKEAAAMMLTDDNFASIVAAVEEGRGMFGNIKKYLMYLLSANIGETLLMVGAMVMGVPLPLSAVQILYLNLATDGLPALALAVDPPERDLMSRPPRNQSSGIFTRPVTALMLTGGAWSAAVNLALFLWALRSGRDISEAMTMTFTCLIFIEFFKAYAFRSDHFSVLRSPFINRWLNLSILWGIALLVAVVYLPFFQGAFGTYAIPLRDWSIIMVCAVTVLPVLEFAKICVRKFA